MNHYYLETILETKQRELDRVSREGWKMTAKKKPALLKRLTRFLFTKKIANPQNQVCCA
jgi:hypothetical protein